MRKLALLIEYDGSGYHGFQLQSNAGTVQAVVEDALHRITGEHNRLRGASRTDTGVHALGQVATFTTEAGHSPETFVAALNYYLPEDISVRDAEEVPAEFDARRQALQRRYLYLILNRATRSPVSRRYSLWVRQPLDAEAMDRAARLLEGRHDFASFSGPLARAGASTVREVYRARVGPRRGFLALEVAANAFLPQQVRRTVGLLLEVGSGGAGPEDVEALLERPALGRAQRVAPPHGLYLVDIAYGPGGPSFPRARRSESGGTAPAILGCDGVLT